MFSFLYSYYVESCILNDSLNDLIVFRIISLWFANKSNPTIYDVIKHTSKIASYKFINVMPQITARLTNSDNQFNLFITQIIERCAIDHPHHTINQILSLANSYKDTRPGDCNEMEPRVIGAKNLIAKLQENEKISAIVLQMKQICAYLITFANEPVKEKQLKYESNTLSNLKRLTAVQCLTLDLPIQISGEYKNITSIECWRNKVTLVGGINAPKKIMCVCSDGVIRTQLLKGTDDLRQDAVMQQVFMILNTLLSRNKEANRRKLSVRCYKVVPLSQRSGIIEWCENTLPLAAYLLPAHKKYRPNDLAPIDCRKKMTVSCIFIIFGTW